jgi:branched-chain amino acid transport system permease protein
MNIYSDNKNLDGVQRLLDKACLTPLGFIGLLILTILPQVPGMDAEYMVRWLTLAAFMAACSVVFDFTSGFINIVNFGFMAFAGLGAYASAILVVNTGVSPWIGMLFAMFVTGLLGFFTGIITLRLRGIFAAVMTWFVALALMGLATKLVGLTHGPSGLIVPKFYETASNIPYYYTALIIMLVCYFICTVIVRSRNGIAFLAIGQNMDAARASGINPVYYRLLNFTVSCILTGAIGSFYAHYFGVLTPEVMHTSKTVEVLAISFIGGRASLWGGAFTAFPFMLAMENIRAALSNLPGVHLVIYGVFLIVVMIYYPGGIADIYYKIVAKFRNNKLFCWLIAKGEEIPTCT